MNEEEKKVKLDLGFKDTKQPEVTPEYIDASQRLLDFVKEGADEIAKKSKQRKEARRKEVIALRGGLVIPFEQYILSNSLQDYFAIFPNDNPFFGQMFRLAGWKDLDPNKYIKPLAAKHYLVEIIYYRFHKEILPVLKAKATPGKHKLFQLLTDNGIEKILQFRDEAVEMMQEFPDGNIYEFRLAYAAKYKTDVQLELISEHR